MSFQKLRHLAAVLGAAALLSVAPSAHAATNIVTGPLTGTNTWTADNVYLLTNYVYVLSNAVLRIEPGTVIKGRDGTAPNFGTLFICRGGKIYAEGTPNKPIIFTAETDDLSDPDDKQVTDRGLWGGLVILGQAVINSAVNAAGDAASPRYEVYEGLPDDQISGQFVHRFGGSNDDDDSGVVRYVSLRHGGRLLAANKEINGLSLGAVGRGTVVEYVEVLSFADDGFEFFGGTVNTKYLVSAFNDDDAFDTDMGYSGKNQFWFGIQANDRRDHGGELNGELNERNDGTRLPRSTFEVYNATLVGAGANAGGSANNNTFVVRLHSRTRWFNSVFTDFNGAPFNGNGPLTGAAPTFQNNLWFGYTTPTFTDPIFTTTVNTNQQLNPQLRGISRTQNGGLDPRPAAGSPAFSDFKPNPADSFYNTADYRGAFSAGDLWLKDWTFLSQGGFAPQATNEVIWTSNITGDVTWSCTNIYILTNYVYVLSNAVLRIEPGTVIKGRDGAAPNFGSLFVTRGAKIYAEGTPHNPIIFTAEGDDLSDPDDLGPTDRGLWGGLVILGQAVINSAVNAAGDAASPRYEVYEGLPDDQISGQFVHRFGGSNDDDDSGVLRHVSFRHGGRLLVANKEINGLSLGAVGRGTTIECVETFAFADDGFEFFGGTVNTKYLVSAFNDDDAFDTDMGYSGRNQFWFGIQANDRRDHGGELNGELNERNDGTRLPRSTFEVYNATLVGAGANAGGSANNNTFVVRLHSRTKWFNSVFTDFNGAPFNGGGPITGAAPTFQDNIWFGYTTPTFTDAIFTTAANSNRVVDPQLGGISRTASSLSLDPLPAATSPALTGARPTPVGGIYSDAPYQGAFKSANWMRDWTFLSQGCFLKPAGGAMPKSLPTVDASVDTADGGATASVSYPSAAGYQYKVQSSTDLVTWTDETGWTAGNGGTKTVNIAVPGVKKLFRVLVR